MNKTYTNQGDNESTIIWCIYKHPNMPVKIRTSQNLLHKCIIGKDKNWSTVEQTLRKMKELDQNV